MSTLYYGLARMDICPAEPWMEDVSIDVRADGTNYQFQFLDYLKEEAKAYLDDLVYAGKCKITGFNILNTDAIVAIDSNAANVYSYDQD